MCFLKKHMNRKRKIGNKNMRPKMTRDKKKFFGNGPSGLIILVAVFVVGVVLLSTLTEVSSTIVHLSTTDFYEYVEQGKID